MAEKRRIPKRKITVPKECYFCAQKKVPWYSDTASLQKFVSDRSKIIVRTRTGLCAKHQRAMTIAIKHARHLALMPFVARD
jgi:small subunit ribosomal protein S18